MFVVTFNNGIYTQIFSCDHFEYDCYEATFTWYRKGTLVSNGTYKNVLCTIHGTDITLEEIDADE